VILDINKHALALRIKKVLFNGEEIKGVYIADDETGVIIGYKLNDRGEPLLNASGEPIIYSKVGKVEIVLDDSL